MDPRTIKKVNRLLDQMERRARRPRRFPTSPILLGIGLVIMELLLTRLVPRAWAALLPRGLEQASGFQGWPRLVWNAALFCHRYEQPVFIAIAVVTILGFVVASRSRLIGILIWLSAVGVILLDAGIIVVTILTSLQATSADAGIPLGLG